MKKILLSGFVILTFAFYSFNARHGNTSTLVKPVIQGSPAASSESEDDNSGKPRPSSVSIGSGPPSSSSPAKYKDGRYTGSVADAYYGYIQVLAVISGGKLTDVKFLQYPHDQSNSVYINSQAMPYLKQEALQAQNAKVNVISGATDTSQAFVQSLTAALNKANG